jgi:branched-subunit amino acid aminotransferase/4-amino-4-deoxychorismate lyase
MTLAGPAGTLTETSIGHVLAVMDGTVMTPPRGTVLDGISLRVTGELCRAAGIPFAEAPFRLTERLQGIEFMLTGTGFCLAGVRELWTDAGEPIRFRWPGPVLRRLLAAWSDLVGVDVEQQFLES